MAQNIKTFYKIDFDFRSYDRNIQKVLNDNVPIMQTDEILCESKEKAMWFAKVLANIIFEHHIKCNTANKMYCNLEYTNIYNAISGKNEDFSTECSDGEIILLIGSKRVYLSDEQGSYYVGGEMFIRPYKVGFVKDTI